jgi:t-SNARE complex subunit (syntaxin)
MRKKDIFKLDKEIENLKNQLDSLILSEVPQSEEHYNRINLRRLEIEEAIADIEVYIEKEFEHQKRMRPLYFVFYVFIFFASAFITYFLMMYS